MRPYRSCAPPSTICFHEGQLLAWGIPATGVLVETLLDRCGDGDVAEAEAASERLSEAPTDESLVLREIWLLRLHALQARAEAMRPVTATIGIATARRRGDAMTAVRPEGCSRVSRPKYETPPNCRGPAYRGTGSFRRSRKLVPVICSLRSQRRSAAW
jgi:hypothetical protein